MRSQTVKPSPARPETIGRRPVADTDAEFLLQVYASTRQEEMAMVDWTDAEKDAFLRGQLAAQKADYDARFPDACHEIILLDDRPIGQIWVGRTEEEIRLLDIALLPEYRGRGIGTTFLKELQEETVRAAKPMRHCVYKENEPALGLYKRLGFNRVADLGMYYLMEWNGAATAEKET